MKKLRFLVSLIMEENHYQKQHAAAVQDAAQRLGVDIEIVYAGNDPITQTEQLLNGIQSTAKESRPDGILCAPVGTSLVQVARQAAKMGIGWGLLNREGDYIGELRASSQAPIFAITIDQAEIGRIQGRQIGALLPQGGMVLYLLGPTGNPLVEQRSTWMQTLKPANVQVRTLTGDLSQQSGYKAIARWLQLRTSHETPVTLIAGQNDDMALGARRAFEDQTIGAQREQWTSLPYIGVDCCPGAGQDWVRQGLLAASVINPPTAGIALETMVQAIRSKSQPAEVTVVAPTSFPTIEKLTGATALKTSQMVC
ncbi:MAG TPA: sugar ABC transporter substrate-binding protein [Terriglobales bacterium]|nr:sugar ABC transporter substrate-binding protein [Terriglobales bacterium]